MREFLWRSTQILFFIAAASALTIGIGTLIITIGGWTFIGVGALIYMFVACVVDEEP